MSGTSLLALIDDIASLLDDTLAMTKVAAQKTAGVLGDDLALNAEQVAGVSADRELPVIWAVAKGSARNKLILVPAALGISTLMPWLITPLLMIGGGFLCFEGFEKVAHKLIHKPEADEAEKAARRAALTDPAVDMVAFEKERVSGAIRTDFILSAEIIVLTLGAVAEAELATRISVVAVVAVLITVGVYGLVAGIVKIDDLGLALCRREAETTRRLGRGLVAFAPYLMKGLSIAGTVAMFLVGGGILAHGLGPLHRAESALAEMAGGAGFLAATLMQGLVGIVAGGLLVALATGVKRVLSPAEARETETSEAEVPKPEAPEAEAPQATASEPEASQAEAPEAEAPASEPPGSGGSEAPTGAPD